MLVLRTRASAGGGRTLYDLSVSDAKQIPFDPAINYFNEQLNDQHKSVTFQGEICRSIRGLEIRYSCCDLPMRPALLEDPHHAHGLTALMYMQHFCCSRGYDCIMELMDDYPDHVVEFTCFDRACGALGWRTIVWEVRNY